MLYKQLDVTTTETDQDQGTFVALVSAWTLDREGDTIERHAFDTTIEAWQQSGKRLPLLFDHSAEEIGSVDPKGMHTTDEGLVVPGEVDRSTEHGQQAWRSIKRGTASFSIGYLTTEERRTANGRNLLGVDLFEISYTPTPMHPDTRALSWKNAAVKDEWARLSEALATVGVETKATTTAELRAELERAQHRPKTTAELRAELERARAGSKTTDELRAEFERVTKGIDLRPVHVAEFDA